jgi:hypothetical protein
MTRRHYVHKCPDMAATGRLCADCRHIEEVVAAAPPLTARQIAVLRPIVGPLIRAAAEEIAERRRLDQRFAGLRAAGEGKKGGS